MSDTMAEVRMDPRGDVSQWWEAVADCRRRGLTAADAHWRLDDGQQDLFATGVGTGASGPRACRHLPPVTPLRRTPEDHGLDRGMEVSADLRRLIDLVLLHSDPARFALAHRLVDKESLRPRLLHDHADVDVARARAMEKSVRRDLHKMKAFVRFRRLADDLGTDTYVAWFEPEHHIVEAVAPFFVRRFASMRWSILTPGVSVHWDMRSLDVGPGAQRSDAPGEDPVESIWRSYYANIFNPARLKVKAMTSEMPKKYWRNLPEAELITSMIRAANTRTSDMISTPATAPHVKARVRSAPATGATDAAPDRIARLADMPAGINACKRCSLHCDATQGVPGEGSDRATLMIVGEQPGDQEDLAGRPFVGPAGRVLDEAMKRVGIARDGAFVTNAVKHFKFEPRGKRRIHKKPDVSEIEACRWWLDRERELVRPELVVALGATAARSLMGKATAVSAVRGRVLPLDNGAHLLVTVHPSYLLRLQNEDDKRREWRAFLHDLTVARDWLAGHAVA